VGRSGEPVIGDVQLKPEIVIVNVYYGDREAAG
jgi:hypothetical protein